jgi:hypothetical protein
MEPRDETHTHQLGDTMTRILTVLFAALALSTDTFMAQEAGEMLRGDVLDAAKDRVGHTIPVELPASARFATFILEIENPSALDLDLSISEAAPGGRSEGVLCTSDGSERLETCVVRRPASGRVVANVKPYDDIGASRYTLRMVLGEVGQLTPGESVEIGTDGDSFQVSVAKGQVAIVRLAGTSRPFGAIDSAGNAIAPIQIDPLRRAIVLGRPVRNSTAIFEGIEAAATYKIAVGPTGDRFTSSTTAALSLIVTEAQGASGYVIPFTAEQTETISGSGPVEIKRRFASDPTVFALTDSAAGGIARVVPAEFDIALCDEFGRALNISESEVPLTDVKVLSGGPASQSSIGRMQRVAGGQGRPVYIAIFRSPFATSKPTSFEVHIDRPMARAR